MKIIKGCSIFLISVLVFVGCAGTQDWAYSLPNEYKISRSSPNDISITAPIGKKSTNMRVDSLVIKFCYNDRFIGAIRISINDVASYYNGKEVLKEWYIVDTNEDSVYGPFTEQEYNDKLEILLIHDMDNWIETSTRPEGAEYFTFREV